MVRIPFTNHPATSATVGQPTAATIFECIEAYCWRQRINSSLSCVNPEEFEASHGW